MISRTLFRRAATAAALVLTLSIGLVPAAFGSIAVRPEAPTVCDPVALLVSGQLPDPCYQIIRSRLDGPHELPTAGPIAEYEIRVRIVVQEPEPGSECTAVVQPYTRDFALGRLGPGIYFVRSVEYRVPFTPDSSGTPTDSTVENFSFEVAFSNLCPPGPDCYLLSFGIGRPDSTRFDACNAVGRPGGVGCYDISLGTGMRIGGVQTRVAIVDPSVATRQPVPPELLHPISVEAVGRARGFQAAWTAEGSVVKILLYSSTGAVIEPGDGPILHVCYAIGNDARVGRYPMHFLETIVANPAGVSIPPCPTFAEVAGLFCIGGGGCDLNGDGVSDIRDIVLLVRCALSGGAGGTAGCPDPVAGHADCNRDGAIDIRDVICCVRAIIGGPPVMPPSVGTLTGPRDPMVTDVRYEGPVEWASPFSGRATLRVLAGTDVAGVQLWVRSEWSRAHVRRLALESPADGVHLEWARDGAGGVRAMLYRDAAGAPLGDRIRIRVDLESADGPEAGDPRLRLGYEASTADGVLAPTASSAPTAAIPAPGTVAAPTVMAAAPNPFVSETEIAYALPAGSRVTLRIYDASGRLVRTLVDSAMPAGVHRVRWDGTDRGGRTVASGIYFFKFSAGTVERTQRILRLR